MDENEVRAFGCYSCPHLLPTGEWAGIQHFLYTWALVVGIDRNGYRTRYCYERQIDAETALAVWDGQGDPPGPWIKRKGDVEKLGPGATQ